MLSLDDYKKKLADGGYKSLGGARKGIGKASGWDEATKATASKLAEKHFAGTEGAAKPTAKKAAATGDAPKRRGRPPKSDAEKAASAAAKKTTAPVASSDAPKRRGRPPKNAAAASAAPVPRAPRAARSSNNDITIPQVDFSHVRTAIELAKEALETEKIGAHLGADAAKVAENAVYWNDVLRRCSQEVTALLQKSSIRPPDPEPAVGMSAPTATNGASQIAPSYAE